ncbi:MAG: MotA/TolQ/ExbB proton channel family protein [Phycisphaeraceae bacterium]|nr:MotA/TolQ/ExbB proton channel family protein [Phycisphaeraceae bacterium]
MRRTLFAAAILAASPPLAMAQAPTATGIWPLFVQSFDFFTILLLAGSVAAGAYIFRAMVEVRPGAILPPDRTRAIQDMVKQGRFAELRGYVEKDGSFLSRVLAAAFAQGSSRDSMREGAEMAASEQVAGWFRRIEPLNVIGNLGPLVGLAGTVWGMILAFTTLGQAGGQAGPSDLSLGISKALFHTLLGLCLAIPCLLVFGFYRSIVDRHCTRAMVMAADLVEKLPVEGSPKA